MNFRNLSISDHRGALRKLFLRFGRDRSGATMIEYGLIVGTISIAILLTMTTMGTTLRDGVFTPIVTAIKAADADVD